MDRIAQLNDFLKQQPGDPFLLHALALEYIKLGEDDKARSLFETLLSQNESYVGSYYHLGKLLERQGRPREALGWYEKGMAEAKKAGNRHAYAELQAAREDLEEEL